jgi:hypothetical protein
MPALLVLAGASGAAQAALASHPGGVVPLRPGVRVQVGRAPAGAASGGGASAENAKQIECVVLPPDTLAVSARHCSLELNEVCYFQF